MRIVQFSLSDDSIPSRIGIVKNDVITDCTHEGLPSTLVELLNQDKGLETLTRVAAKATKTYPVQAVQLLPPITKPDKVLCIGLNYKKHCNETNQPYPPQPVVFSKFSSTIIGPADDIVKPSGTEALDWEVELVVVIGRKASNVSIEKAYDYVLGYTIGQDLTARDLTGSGKNGGQFLLGKSMDKFCPIGPWIVTKDEIPDPHALNLKTWVNGILKQNGATDDMIHKIDKIVSYISSIMTLYPGDIIMTGTPSGVGFTRNPPESLQRGDTIDSEIENIGKLSNKVV